MAGFESWKQYLEFSSFVMRKSRHILDAKSRRFLDAVVETSEKRKGSIEKGAVLWRAQRHGAVSFLCVLAGYSGGGVAGCPWVQRAWRTHSEGSVCAGGCSGGISAQAVTRR